MMKQKLLLLLTLISFFSSVCANKVSTPKNSRDINFFTPSENDRVYNNSVIYIPLSVSITGPSSFCPGATATLIATVSGCQNSAVFVWKRNGVIIPGAITSSYSADTPGNYSVSVSCGSANVTSTSFVLSRLTLKTNVQNSCPGSTGNVNLIVINGSSPFTYAWNTGATTQDLIGVTSGNYSVAVTDANGCIATTIATVNNTLVNINAGISKSICSGDSATLQASGADLYFWSPSTGLSNTNISNPVANPTATTTYTVTGYVASGELVTNGDFNQGNNGFLSDYSFVNGFANTAVGYSSGTGLYPESKFTVVANRTDSNVTLYHPAFFGNGHNQGNTVGRNDDKYMAINGATVLGQKIWSQTVEVVPNNNYSFSAWITSINAGNPSLLRFLINGIEIGPQISAPSELYTWKQFYTVWNSGSATTAEITIINDNSIASGNDFGLDDISFSTTCSNSSTVTITVNSPLTANAINNPQVTTFCLNGDAGIIQGALPTGGNGTYTYQWQLSSDDTTWSNINGATDQSYNPGVVYSTTRYRRIVTSGSCSSESNICTITITASTAINNNTITAPATSSFCISGDPSNISGSTPSGGGNVGSFSYVWLSSTDGNNFSIIAGATGTSYNPGVVTQTTYFRRVVSKGSCNSDESNIILISINQSPSIDVISTGSVCGSGSATLEVQSESGATIKWYATEQSSAVLNTTSIFSTPSVTQTTTYYAQATKSGCTSDRIPVVVTVNQIPTVASVTNGSVCGSGDVTLSAISSSGSIQWYSEATDGALLGTGQTFTASAISFNTTVYAQALDNGCSSERSAVTASIITKPQQPTIACYQSANFNSATCSWDITGTQPTQPTIVNCWDNFIFNTSTCVWDNTGVQPVQPAIVNCWDNFVFNTSTCVWDNTGVQPVQPAIVNCWDNFVFNTSTCVWDNTGVQPTQPAIVNCWDNFVFNTSTCVWDNAGVQPTQPTIVNCWDNFVFNTSTCVWDNTGVQPVQPAIVNCWDNFIFNTSTCVWDNTGVQPTQPAIVNCWDNFIFNTATCVWDNTGVQPTQPAILNCWDNFVFNASTCVWDNTGVQPTQPAIVNCWDNFVFNTSTCVWDNTGVQTMQPAKVNCWDNFVFNTSTCVWNNTGVQPVQPAIVNCWDNFVFNTSTCVWDNTGSQPSAPTVSVTQPTCSTPKGIITVTSLIGSGFAYRLNNGTYQSSTVFNNLSAGSYSVTVKNSSGCVSTATVVVIVSPASLSAPTLSVTQPTCSTPKGRITVTSPIGSGFAYRLNNGNYQSATVFSNLSAGCYSVTVKNSSGCVSTATVAVIASPATLSAPTVSVTQPTCSTPKGRITVTSPIGSGFTYSLNNGTYQSATVFSNLSAGCYSVTVKNSSGCISTAKVVVIASPASLSAPTVSVTQPTCLTPKGRITVTSPIGSGFSYSLNNGTYQSATVFSNLSVGSYNVTVKNSSGCVSSAKVVVIASPASLSAPTVSVTQPSCSTPKGRITVTSPIGNGFTYSLNNGTYQSATVFSNLSAGRYSVTVKNSSGCVSNTLTVNINSSTSKSENLSTKENIFKVNCYPNPFYDSFNLNVETSNSDVLTVKVYDLLGKLLDDRTSKIMNIETIQIGENYPSGIYSITVSQGENVKFFKMVKH
jgi:hypothetical protein